MAMAFTMVTRCRGVPFATAIVILMFILGYLGSLEPVQATLGHPPRPENALRNGQRKEARHASGFVAALLGGLGLPGPLTLLNPSRDEDPDMPPAQTHFTFCNLIPEAGAVARLVRDRSHYTPALQYQQCITQSMPPGPRDQVLEVYHAPGSIATDQRQITRTYHFNPVNGSANLLLLTQDPTHGLWELTIPKAAASAEPPSGDSPLMDVVLFNGATERVSWAHRASQDNGDSWGEWALVPGAQGMQFKEYLILPVHRNDSARQLAEFRLAGVMLPEFRLNYTEVAEQVRAAHVPPPSRNASELSPPAVYPTVRILVALTGQAVGIGGTDDTTPPFTPAASPISWTTPASTLPDIGVDDDSNVEDSRLAALDLPELYDRRGRRRSFPLEIAGYYTTSPAASRLAGAASWVGLSTVGIVAAAGLLCSSWLTRWI